MGEVQHPYARNFRRWRSTVLIKEKGSATLESYRLTNPYREDSLLQYNVLLHALLSIIV